MRSPTVGGICRRSWCGACLGLDCRSDPLGLHPRQDPRPRARQEARRPCQTRLPRPPKPRRRPPRSPESPKAQRPARSRAWPSIPSSAPGRHPVPHPHLHRSRRRLCLCLGHSRQSTCPTQAARDEVLTRPPQPPQVLLSDNGGGFEASLAQSLERHDIRRWGTDPRTPPMNAHAERLRRTLQVDDHEEPLFTALPCSTRNRPTGGCPQHRVPPPRLVPKTPPSFLLHHQPQCPRWWTCTGS